MKICYKSENQKKDIPELPGPTETTKLTKTYFSGLKIT